MDKVKGTIQKAGVYHANVKIPVVLRRRYGKEIYRLSLRTSDKRTAESKVAMIRATLETEREAAERNDALHKLAAALAPDQRKLFKEAGGLAGLLKRYEASKDAQIFMEAARPSEWDGLEVEGSDVAYLRGETFVLRKTGNPPTRIDTGNVSDPDELTFEQIEHDASSAAMKAQANKVGKTLRALGEDADVSDVHSLRDVVEDYAPSVDPQTADAARTIVRRFHDYHGELALPDLRASHLREFTDAMKGLPKVQSGKRREMTFKELLADAKNAKAETIGFATQRKAFDLLRGLMTHALGRGFIDVNPWAGSRLKAPKKKHSAKKVRRSFTAAELATILTHVRGCNDPQYGAGTIDRMAPIVAAYHGLRLQEASQLRVADFAERDGIWSMQITDEGEGQRAKTQSSVRWVPVHPTIAPELRALVDARRKEAGEDSFLCQYWHRYKKRMMELEPDNRGRVSGSYGKRFASMLDRLGLDDPGIVFHSFRHRLQDAADTAGIPDSHRRYLTGRANKDAVEGGYGEGASMPTLYSSLAAINPLR